MDTKVINGIRSLAIDIINESGSGYPGISLSAAPIIYTLFANHLNFNKDDGTWINRDRFVLSAGHASALLYSILFYSGYNIELEDLKKYRRKNGILPGIPEINQKLGIEITTGHSGEGLANSVGIAIAETYIKNLLGGDIVDYFTYVFVTDEDLMEGVSYEAASLAGTLKLGKLIVLYESNGVTMDGSTKGVFDEDVLKRFETMGWDIEIVQNGEDYLSIDKAITRAKNIKNKPSIIEIKTIIGIGTSNSGTSKVYSGVLSLDDTNMVKEKMNISKVPFHVSKEAVMYFRDKIDLRISSIYNDWVGKYNKVIECDEVKKRIILDLEDKNIKLNLKNLQVHFDVGMREDMCITNSNLMNVICKYLPLFVGGSANANLSSNIFIEDNNKNINFGARESAMGGILNGMAISGLRPFGSTSLINSDYMKPSIRLSSMMKLPTSYIFTHDSIRIGDDGPTKQPIEQLASLRTIPNMTVFRPADVNELVGSWNYILNKKLPCALIIPKEEKGILSGSSIEDTEKGAYIIKNERGRLAGVIVSTGSEVEVSLEISNELDERGIMTRVVSMPSIELFNKQSEDYKNMLFPIGAKVIVIEASNDPTWNMFVYNKKYLLTLDSFGISGTKNEILEYMHFDFNSLLEKTEKLLK